MNDADEEVIQMYMDAAAHHGAWKLYLHWQWRLISGQQGGIGSAWPKDVVNKLTFENA